jgi:hypothetical protein
MSEAISGSSLADSPIPDFASLIRATKISYPRAKNLTYTARVLARSTAALMRRPERKPGAGRRQRGTRWSAGRRLLKSPPGSHPGGTPEGASADGTRNPVLLARGFGPGAGLAILRLAPRGPRKPPAPPGAPFPFFGRDGKKGEGCTRTPTNGRRSVGLFSASWPDLFRPSTSGLRRKKEDVDARDKRGHDASRITAAPGS